MRRTAQGVENEVAEDWSRRVGRVRGLEHLRVLRESFVNYAEAELGLFRRHGDVARVKLPAPIVFFFRPRHVKRVLRTHVLNFPKSRDYEPLRPLLGDGIFVSEGELWTRQRKLLAPEFREASLPRFLPLIVESAEQLFGEWDEKLAHGPVDVTADMMRLTLWIVGRAMFRSEFLAEAEVIGRTLARCLEHATWQMLWGGMYKRWFPTARNRAAKRAERELNEVVMRIIRRGRAADDGAQDVLSRMMRAKDAETGHQMSDQQLLDEIKSLVLAGHETTSLALSWGFALLARHPAAYARLAEEAQMVFGDRRPEAADLARLEYSRMVFLETLRLYPPVPAVTRNVLTATEIDGVRVEPGEMVGICPYVTHRHPEYWPEAERFDPERFSSAGLDRIEPYSYLPFLLGRRACLGQHFAMLEGVLLLALIARRYELSLAADDPIQSHPISTLRFEKPLMMRVELRV
jgi:cytochrome P450